jgi:hypothetical protein
VLGNAPFYKLLVVQHTHLYLFGIRQHLVIIILLIFQQKAVHIPEQTEVQFPTTALLVLPFTLQRQTIA